MTLISPTPSSQATPSMQPTASLGGADEIGARVWQAGRDARLDEVLHAVVLDALGPDARITIAREDWARVEDAIRGPVAAAASAALERLASDLETDLPRQMPELVRRLGDQRARTELGYD